MPSIAIYSQVCLKLVSVVYLSYLQACWNLELRKQTQKEKKKKNTRKIQEKKKNGGTSWCSRERQGMCSGLELMGA